MTTAAPTTALVMIQPAFTDAERLALAGYLAGYRGLTREAYALDLRQFTCWCRDRSLSLFAVRRADIEGFARELEARGRARATVTRRLCTIAGFYKYAVEEELLGTPRPPTSAGRGWTMSPTRSPWTATSSAPAGRGRARLAARARADLAARDERAAGVGGHRRRHRAPGPGTRAPDADHHPQGRQGRHHPAGAAHRPGDRPGHRRTSGQAGVPAAAGGGWTVTAPDGSSARSRATPGSPRPSRLTRSGTHSSPLRSMPGVPLRDVQEAASHADPRTTMWSARACPRQPAERHATYIVAAYIAGAAR